MTVFEVLPWITTITAAPILFVGVVVSRASLAGGARMSLRSSLALMALCVFSVVVLGAAWTIPEVGWVVALQAVAITTNVAIVAVTLKHWSMQEHQRDRGSVES